MSSIERCSSWENTTYSEVLTITNVPHVSSTFFCRTLLMIDYGFLFPSSIAIVIAQ